MDLPVFARNAPETQEVNSFCILEWRITCFHPTELVKAPPLPVLFLCLIQTFQISLLLNFEPSCNAWFLLSECKGRAFLPITKIFRRKISIKWQKNSISWSISSKTMYASEENLKTTRLDVVANQILPCIMGRNFTSITNQSRLNLKYPSKIPPVWKKNT